MPVIMEEDEGVQMPLTDFSELLGIPEGTFPGSSDGLNESTLTSEAPTTTCPVHPGQSSCLCNDFLGDWDLPEPAVEPYVGVEEPDYAKFENVRLSLGIDLIAADTVAVDPTVHPA